MSMKEIVSKGEDFEVEQVDRGFGSARKSALKVDGSTGDVTMGGKLAVAGKPVLGGDPNLWAVINGRVGAGTVVLAGAKVGDKVSLTFNTGSLAIASAFESTITVAGHIQQTSGSDLSAQSYLVLVVHQS